MPVKSLASAGFMADENSSTTMPPAAPIYFGKRLAGSDAFKAMFREGMALVEETANYLDGDGRRESKDLPRTGTLAYATESMRLTTRLMQLASWLLLQRAVNDGELSAEQANSEKSKVKLGGLASATGGPGWDDLPQRLRDLIVRSIRLQERVRKLDGILEPAAVEAEEAENPVARQIGRLSAAFGGR
jgi:regulator of CtrA degradation